MSLPFFPLYPKDFEAKTSHLTLDEDGAYNRLLRLMWMTPGCSFPDDDAWIMRRMRVDQDTYERVVKVIIDEFCERKNGRVSNARLLKVFNASEDAHKKRVSAGSKGGKSKALKNNDIDPSNAKAMLKQPEPEPYIEKDKPKGLPKKTPRQELENVLSPELAEAVIEHRKRLRKPLTSRAAKILAGKFAKTENPDASADVMIANGWQGFEPEWIENRKSSLARGSPQYEHPRLTAKKAAIDKLFGDDENEQRSANEAQGVVLMLPSKSGR